MIVLLYDGFAYDSLFPEFFLVNQQLVPAYLQYL